MAITTIDGALAGMQTGHYFFKASISSAQAGRMDSPWYNKGIPGPGVADTSTAGGVVRSSSSSLVTGQIPYYDPTGGNLSYLSKLVVGSAAASGTIMFCDRLWDCGAINTGAALSATATTSQNVASIAFPPRDDNGTANGVGVIIGLEVSSSTGAGTPNVTMTYTNSSGVAGRTANQWPVVVASGSPGAFYPFMLQSGDVGVQSVQTIQLSGTMTAGQFVLVAYRVLATIEMPVAGAGGSIDLMTGGFKRLWNGTVPMLIQMPTNSGVGFYHGYYNVTQG